MACSLLLLFCHFCLNLTGVKPEYDSDHNLYFFARARVYGSILKLLMQE